MWIVVIPDPTDSGGLRCRRTSKSTPATTEPTSWWDSSTCTQLEPGTQPGSRVCRVWSGPKVWTWRLQEVQEVSKRQNLHQNKPLTKLIEEDNKVEVVLSGMNIKGRKLNGSANLSMLRGGKFWNALRCRREQIQILSWDLFSSQKISSDVMA